MNELRAIDSRPTEEAAPIQPIDCGRASEATRGLPFMLLLELGLPPFNKIFLI